MPNHLRESTLRTIIARAWITCLLLLLPHLVGAEPASPAPQRTSTILVIGDSLSAGYGMAAAESWVALLGERLQREFPGWQVINASISGETSAGGASRIADHIARHHPSVVIIELGGNDGLRGLPLVGNGSLRDHLMQMIETAQQADAHVLLLGMQMPPNLGADYTRHFARIYPELAERYQTALVPFLLDPIARERTAFQEDNIHPTAAVQPRLVDHVWPALRPLLNCPVSTSARQCQHTSIRSH